VPLRPVRGSFRTYVCPITCCHLVPFADKPCLAGTPVIYLDRRQNSMVFTAASGQSSGLLDFSPLLSANRIPREGPTTLPLRHSPPTLEDLRACELSTFRDSIVMSIIPPLRCHSRPCPFPASAPWSFGVCQKSYQGPFFCPGLAFLQPVLVRGLISVNTRKSFSLPHGQIPPLSPPPTPPPHVPPPTPKPLSSRSL